MNRRSFIRTLTASGVSLFLPKVIEPMRWKRNLFWMNTAQHGFHFKGAVFYCRIMDEEAYMYKFNDGHDEPFSISVWITPEQLTQPS